MTGMVLALATLTCGDGGPGTGAARAAVESAFTQTWVGLGECYCSGAVVVDFKRGYYRFLPDGKPVQFRVTAVRGQDVRVRRLGEERLGIFRIDGDMLLLVVSQKANTRPRSFDLDGGEWFFHLFPTTRTPPPAPKRPGGDWGMPGMGLPGMGLPGRGFPGGGFGRPAAPRKP
jgi:hypothetical protein